MCRIGCNEVMINIGGIKRTISLYLRRGGLFRKLGTIGSLAPDLSAVIPMRANQGRLRRSISRRFAQFQEQNRPDNPT